MPNLLIVEDQPYLRESIRIIFEETFSIKTAANGREALEILKTWQPDVMITDYAMPGMVGLDLIRIIREIEKNIVGAYCSTNLRNKQIKIILISACMTCEMREEAKRWAVAACLEKPFELEEIRNIVLRK